MTRNFALASVAALALVGSAVVSAQPGRPANDEQRPRLEQRGPGQGQGAMRGQGPMRGQGQRGQGFRQGPGVRRGGPGGPGMALRGLDLTDAQKEQVKAIHDKARQDVEALLTPEQLEKLKARRGR